MPNLTRKKRPTHIYFDWSGTIAHKGSREAFISGKTMKAKRATLYPDTLRVLSSLHNYDYKLGIISNTSCSPRSFKKALRDAGLSHYFNAAIVTNTSDVCRKPCEAIFRKALKLDKIKATQALMVGDNYEKDVKGARRVGFQTFHKTRKRGFSLLLNKLCEQRNCATDKTRK